MLPVTLIRLSTMGCEDGIVLFLGGQRDGISTVCFKPFVKLILIEYPPLPWLSGRYRSICQFHVQSSQRNTCVLYSFLHRHRLVVANIYQKSLILVLLSGQQGSHAHHLIPKLGDDLRKIVES